MCVSHVVLWVSLKYQVENLSCYCLVVANRYTPLLSAESKENNENNETATSD